MNATEKENAYYAEKYQCIDSGINWEDQYGNKITYTCKCGGKTVPQFDVTHALVMTQCKNCYKYHSINGESFHICG